MEKDLSNYRKSYEKGELLLKDTPENPLELFRTWFNEVDQHFPQDETNAMTVLTKVLYFTPIIKAKKEKQ